MAFDDRGKLTKQAPMTAYRFVERGPAWREEYAELLTDPEGLLGRAGVDVVNRGKRRTVVRAPVDGATLAVKLFDESTWLDRLEGVFVGSSAHRVAHGMALMRAAGLRAPGLVALLEKGRGLVRSGSCVVSEWISDGGQLHQVAAVLTPAERHRFARALGAYLRRLHAAGLFPQDTGSGNILAWRDAGGWQFVLVDLDRVRRYRRLSWRRRRNNLVQLHRSLGRHARPADQVAFLREYLGPVDKGELTSVGADIVAASRRKDAEKGEPVCQ